MLHSRTIDRSPMNQALSVIRVRYWQPAVAVLIVLHYLAGAVCADLYTSTVLSVEWLVDSSDEIFHVEVIKGTGDSDFALKAKSSMKGKLPLKKFLELVPSDNPHWPPESMYRVYFNENARPPSNLITFWLDGKKSSSPSCRVSVGDEWLLYVRSSKVGVAVRPYLFYAMNLTRPRENSGVAAMTASGKEITSRDVVWFFVRNRIALKRGVPAGCNREVIDRWGNMDDWITEKRLQHGYLLRPEDARAIQGGFLVKIENWYWDDPLPGDTTEDLLIVGVVVPADAAALKRLRRDMESDRWPAEEALYALLNYPLEDNASFLERYADDSPRDFVARRVLLYLRYCHEFGDSLNAKLVGDWHLQGKFERVELELRKDHTCSINTVPLRSGASSQYPVLGRGYWSVQEGKLWIWRTHAKINERWKSSDREMLKSKQILQYNMDSVELEGGPPMVRNGTNK